MKSVFKYYALIVLLFFSCKTEKDNFPELPFNQRIIGEWILTKTFGGIYPEWWYPSKNDSVLIVFTPKNLTRIHNDSLIINSNYTIKKHFNGKDTIYEVLLEDNSRFISKFVENYLTISGGAEIWEFFERLK
jgi:hypothetical protein